MQDEKNLVDLELDLEEDTIVKLNKYSDFLGITIEELIIKILEEELYKV